MANYELQLSKPALWQAPRAGMLTSAQAAPAYSLGPWLTALAALLVGYALLGRGVAYFGVPPLYAGEFVLLFGIAASLFATRWDLMLYSPFTWMFAAYCGWGMYRTLPYLGEYKVDALRDAVIYGYSVFALMVAAHLLTQPTRLLALLRAFNRFTLPFVLCAPVIWFVGRTFGASLPTLPWGGVPLLELKAGDIAVHLAAILVFWTQYPEQVYGQGLRFLGMLYMSASIIALGSEARAGLAAFLIIFALCMMAEPSNRSLWKLVGIGFATVLFFAATGLRIPISDRERDISFEQISKNVETIAGGSKASAADGTKGWRLDWWKDITKYTVHGRYFWDGKGFGVNLADDDGYQVGDFAEAIRSPHNAHMTVLARAGVPGLVLWAIPISFWFGGIGAAYFRARLRGERRWAALFLFLFAYWLAMIFNASFDIYLEGPVGGIWFWAVCGVGIASMWLFRYQPELLHWNPESEAAT
jgi:hypothetical protein